MNHPSNESGVGVLMALIDSNVVTVEDLRRALRVLDQSSRRSHAAHLEAAIRACPPRSRQTYTTNFRRLAEAFGDRPLATVTTRELSSLADQIEAASIARGELGYGARASFIHAARCFYRTAIDDGVLAANPAAGLPLPQPRRAVRRALSEWELGQIYECVLEHSGDAQLDLLLLDLHRETAARRGGAISLRLMDVRADRPSVMLREKGGHEREVPVSRELVARLLAHAADRGAASDTDSVLRYSSGRPLTRRRYNTVFELVQETLPWASRLGVSIHWLRHTTLTDISNAAGSRVAAAYAGHADKTVTDRYTRPCFEDLQQAHHAVFNGPEHR